MANDSWSSNDTSRGIATETEEAFRWPWLVGIGASCLCLCAQAAAAGCARRGGGARGYDALVLLQLSAARAANTAAEYCIVMGATGPHRLLKDLVFALYMYSDFALICWMFVFTQNLYDKIVVVFGAAGRRLGVATALIWTLALPFGAVCPLLLAYNVSAFRIYYKTYAVAKLAVIVVNAAIFVRIFGVVFGRRVRSTRSRRAWVRAAAVSFALVCVSCAQVLATDVASLAVATGAGLVCTFCVISSAQVPLVTVIFMVLVRNTEEPAAAAANTLSVRSREVVI